MNLREFKNLTAKQKKFVVLRAGTFLSERDYGIYRKMLYQVEGFYAEVYFTPFSKEPLMYISFDSTDRLQSYLQQIDISALLRESSLSK